MNRSITRVSTTRVLWTLGIGAALLAPACGARSISPQLSAARLVMESARNGSAQRMEPDEVLVAQRNLTLAEQQADGSMLEAHYAYLAERQTRVAMSNARRAVIDQSASREEHAYHQQLEGVARERGVALEQSRDALATQGATLARRDGELAAAGTALVAEREARVEAEAAEATAIERLRALTDVRVTADETVITLSGEVLFETNRSTLRPEARERLTAVADALRASPNQLATVAGYTDSRGTGSSNERLSLARAQAVADFLLAAGIGPERLRAEGRGESSPIASNDSAEGRANNRRVEIILRPMAAQPGVISR